MVRLAAVAASTALTLFGQGFGNLFQKAPPHIEKALSDRVTFFFECHKAGKYRQADAAVHEESKDTFFEAEKLRFRDWKLVSIAWEPDFTRAKVVVDIDTDFMFPGVGKMQVHRPVTSMWRLDGDQWWWYTERNPDGPFGKMTSGEAPKGQGPSPLEEGIKLKPEDLHKMVSADRERVELSSESPGEAVVTISNRFDGPVTLRLDPNDKPGLELSLNKTRVEPKETATLRIRYSPPEAKTKKDDTQAVVHVEELAKRISVSIAFAYPNFATPNSAGPVKPPAPKP